jgi:DNA-binding NtrC family response regulator
MLEGMPIGNFMARRKVLIIDDEIDLSLLLKSYFQRKNFEVFTCHSIAEGLKMLESVLPDILFLDNNLPDGEGWRIAPEAARAHPDLHINLISAYHPNIPDMPENAHFHLIEKPIRLSDLDQQFQNNLENNIEEVG